MPGSGWSGGQYSLLRAGLALWIAASALALLPADSSRSVGLVAAVLALTVALFVGRFDRPAALMLIGLGLLAVYGGALPAWKHLPLVAWLLLAHALTPTAPYGSLAAAGRADPGGGWAMPAAIPIAAWVVLGVHYEIEALRMLREPYWRDGSALPELLRTFAGPASVAAQALEELPATLVRVAGWAVLGLHLTFLPLLLSRVTQRFAWSAMLLVQLALAALAGAWALATAMTLAHLAACDPSWIPRRAATRVERVYYDGTCGLCHRLVRFLLAEEREQPRFRFAPLGGATFLALPAERRAGLPDSVVIEDDQGQLLTRAAAALHVARRLGGFWRLIAAPFVPWPLAWLDRGYDAVARSRRRLFARPETACPVMPPALRARFDD